MDRFDWYFKQRVTEAELDAAFDAVEQAMWNLIVDLEASGVTSGLEPTEATTPDLTIRLTSGVGYDSLGRRAYRDVSGSVDISQDYTGVPTEPSIAGWERWCSVFIRRTQDESDPRIDGNNQTVWFDLAESSEVIVRMGVEALIGTAARPPLQTGEILLCDVYRTAGQTQIFNANIWVDRRQILSFLSGSNIPVDDSTWQRLAGPTVQAALTDADSLFDQHFDGTAYQHADTAITVDDSSFDELSGSTVHAVLLNADASLYDHYTGSGNNHNADEVLADDTGFAVLSGSQIQAVLADADAWLAGHAGGTISRHDTGDIDGAAIAGLPFSVSAGFLNAQLGSLLSDLNIQHNSHFGAEHTAYDDPNGAGYHKTIQFDQPDQVTTDRFLLWETPTTGAVGSIATRCYYFVGDDTTPDEPQGLIFTVNAKWIASTWTRDDYTQNAVALSLSYSQLIMWQHTADAGPANFGAAWDTRVRLRMPYPGSAAGSSSWEIRQGDVTVEQGDCGLAQKNQQGAAATVFDSASVNFKGHFDSAPSSVTLTSSATAFWTTTPTVTNISLRGFRMYGDSDSVADTSNAWWHGYYSAG